MKTHLRRIVLRIASYGSIFQRVVKKSRNEQYVERTTQLTLRAQTAKTLRADWRLKTHEKTEP